MVISAQTPKQKPPPTTPTGPAGHSRGGIFQLNASVAGYDVCGVVEGNGTALGLASCQDIPETPARQRD